MPCRVLALVRVKRMRQWVTYVHENGNNHEFGVEADKGLIFLQVVLLNESFLDCAEEVPVERRVDKENDDLGSSVPDIVDFNKSAQGQ